MTQTSIRDRREANRARLDATMTARLVEANDLIERLSAKVGDLNTRLNEGAPSIDWGHATELDWVIQQLRNALGDE